MCVFLLTDVTPLMDDTQTFPRAAIRSINGDEAHLIEFLGEFQRQVEIRSESDFYRRLARGVECPRGGGGDAGGGGGGGEDGKSGGWGWVGGGGVECLSGG